MGRLMPRQGDWYAQWDRVFPEHRRGAAALLPERQLAMLAGETQGVLLAQMVAGAYTMPSTPVAWKDNGLPAGAMPYDRGRIPPNADVRKITDYNNPNTSTFPSASSSVPRGYRNKLGYRTYVQFMMDQGRDYKPNGKDYTALSVKSKFCPMHTEATAGGNFSFPPREQPTHASRRALIAAMQVVKERNQSIVDMAQRDWVSIVTFDSLANGGPTISLSPTGDYDAAMLGCTELQACGDVGPTTSTESSLIAARNLIKKKSEGGQGRECTNKIVVLLTDGVPNLYSSSDTTINQWISGSASSGEFYNNGAYWLDAPLMQAEKMQLDKWYLYPVGIGLGCDYGFMDRMARLGATAGKNGRGPRGSGNPAEYEQRLTEIFKDIILNPKVRLVQ
jgi:hypothetical protein